MFLATTLTDNLPERRSQPIPRSRIKGSLEMKGFFFTEPPAAVYLLRIAVAFAYATCQSAICVLLFAAPLKSRDAVGPLLLQSYRPLINLQGRKINSAGLWYCNPSYHKHKLTKDSRFGTGIYTSQCSSSMKTFLQFLYASDSFSQRRMIILPILLAMPISVLC
jgi:hypothetical protein